MSGQAQAWSATGVNRTMTVEQDDLQSTSPRRHWPLTETALQDVSP